MKKTNINKNLKYLAIILLLLIIFIFTYGFKILLGTAAFVSQLANKNQIDQIQTDKNSFFGSIDILNIPTATNSPSIIVSGNNTNYDTVDIYLNDDKVDTVKTSDDFNLEIKNLRSGDNEIYFLAKSSETNSTEKTAIYNVVFKKDKPSLEISQPTENQKTNKDEITVIGKTDKEVIIDINNLPVVVNALGEFNTSIKLQQGENKVLITATDIAGNQESKIITVIYEKD